MDQVRSAVVEDATRIAEIHVGSWQVAYAGVLASEFLEGLSIPSREEWWRRRLSTPINQAEVLVVARSGEVLGFASVGPSSEREGEIYAIYLAPDVFRLGLGRQLMAAGEASLGRAGFEEAILWVLEANQRARSFYEAVGWRLDGALKLEELGGVQVSEVRYRKSVGPPIESLR